MSCSIDETNNLLLKVLILLIQSQMDVKKCLEMFKTPKQLIVQNKNHFIKYIQTSQTSLFKVNKTLISYLYQNMTTILKDIICFSLLHLTCIFCFSIPLLIFLSKNYILVDLFQSFFFGFSAIISIFLIITKVSFFLTKEYLFIN